MNDEQPTFEALIGELEAVVQQLEAEAVPLDEAIKLHGRAVKLVRQCQERLDTAEQQIQEILPDGKGGWESQPLD